ncbi:MAG: TonB-dependent receptor [Burkholderiales bacterium]|nr:TonB-dependent receptor [Burkholderiales bacterium]
MRIPSLRRAATAAVFAPALWPIAAASQATAAASAAVIVTGNPLRSTDVSSPTHVLSGESLVLRRGSTLGETLDGLPGVSSSYFGPNANRPMIRGQDSDRIRMLSNSGVPLDASALSYDHAVPIDPLVVERVEVLRGPAALLYGGSAVGGVVNAIDNRVPKAAISGPTGAGELRYGGPSTERGAAALLETGAGDFAWHADAFWRQTDNTRVPWYPRPDGNGGSVMSDQILNSASKSYGGAFGGSRVWNSGFLGAAVDTFRSDYGVVAEPDVTIDMFLNKLTLAGEARDLGGPISAVSGQWLVSNYQHQEIEGSGEVATTFKNRGSDLRLQAEHRTLSLGGGQLQGVFGLQTENADFSALGEEAFVPSTSTRHLALFALEEYQIGAGKLVFGGRVANARIDSEGDGPGQSQFGPPQSRSFTPFSAAVGGVYNLSPQWQLLGNLSYTERAPTFFELYANSLHVATGAYEEGNPNLGLEKGTNLDVALAWKDGPNSVTIGAFGSDFSNYIALLGTGQEVLTDEGLVPVYAFTGVPVRMYGAEVEGTWRLLEGKQTLDLNGSIDAMRSTNEASGQPLPRIPPTRVTLGLTWRMGDWMARAEGIYAAAQDRVPTDDPPTPAYTIVNLSASYQLRLAGSEGIAFLRINNIGNELAYNATTIATVRPLAPLPGRGVMVGLRMNF